MLSNKLSENDQRSGEDRRSGSGGDLEIERRSAERRVLRYAVLFKTGIPYSDLETWLGANCQGEWELVLEDVDGGLKSKTLRIIFETEEDRDRFKASADRIHR